MDGDSTIKSLFQGRCFLMTFANCTNNVRKNSDRLVGGENMNTDTTKSGKCFLQQIENIQARFQADGDETEVGRLLHDFQVYQLELEMQNQELQASRNALHEAHERYMDLYDFAPVGYFSFDRHGRVLEMNITASILLGRERDRTIGFPFSCSLESCSLPLFFRHLREVFSDGLKKTTELRLKVSDKSLRDVRLESIAVTPAKGYGLPCCRTVMIDITEEKKSQAIATQTQGRIEEQLKLTAGVFEHTNEAIIITDADLNIVIANSACSAITGISAEELIGKGYEYLHSGYTDGKVYLKDVRASLACFGYWQSQDWKRYRNGEPVPAWENISVIKNDRGDIINYVCVFSDISALKKTEEQLAHLAHYDPLTKLPNRLLFEGRLEQALQHAYRHQLKMALFFIDLDRFKTINDSLGHDYGDKLLLEIATRIQKCIRSEDTVARLGGDEFTVVLGELNHPEDSARLAEKILAAVIQPVVSDNRSVVVTASIGIGIYPDDGLNRGDLLKAADVAMYRAKENGSNTYAYYTDDLTERAVKNMQIEQDVRDTLAQNNFALHYQPQIDLQSGRLCGVEALLRSKHHGSICNNPRQIIPIAESSGLISEIDLWVLRAACQQIALWRKIGFPSIRVAVNLSVRNFMRNNFPDKVKAILNEFQLPAESIEFEVTESILQTAPQSIVELQTLREVGVMLSIDDFGTGYSSLASLKDLPVDRLKIDKSFIANLPYDQNDVAITKAIISMAHLLNLKVTAEGVETEAQLTFLRTAGCDEVQGFYYSKPVSAAHLQPMLELLLD